MALPKPSIEKNCGVHGMNTTWVYDESDNVFMCRPCRNTKTDACLGNAINYGESVRLGFYKPRY